ncbi:MAG TPA: hypothetical protein VKP65_00060 [Rhodothermales bacterium]|nr:hypothetical protein [Rhodothermales bacterium]
MHIIWENLTAMLLLLGITATLLVINANNQQTLAESTAYYLLRNDGIAFMDLIKRDLKGATEVNSYSAASGTFRFETFIGNETTASTVEYKRKSADQVDYIHEEGDSTWVETVQLYQIERYVNGSLWGGSPSSVADFEMKALNEQNDTLQGGDDLGNCRKIFVYFEMASPHVDIKAVDRMRWETTYVPPSLSETAIL